MAEQSSTERDSPFIRLLTYCAPSPGRKSTCVLSRVRVSDGNLSWEGWSTKQGTMKRSAGAFVLAILLCLSGFGAQQTSPSSPHGNSQDVPKQKPGTENPDVG